MLKLTDNIINIKTLNVIITFITILYSNLLYSQDNNLGSLPEYEDSLKKLASIVLHSQHDFEKYEANEKMLLLFEEALLLPKAFDYSFDSLKTVSRLNAPDNTFRIFTWILPKEDGTYEYFGFVHVKLEKKKKYLVYKLLDNSGNIESPENQTLNADNWYGALYYDIVHYKHNNKNTYTLLGWDGNNRTSTKKIIEVLTFIGSKRKPVFGYSMFRNYKKLTKRVIFEYSSKTSMALRYEKQYLDNVVKTNKKRKESNRKVVRSELRKDLTYMIIFDRLSPLDPRTRQEIPSLEGQYQYYVPETNIFDAFLFQKGKWYFIKDVDARNPKKKETKRKEGVKQLPLYSP